MRKWRRRWCAAPGVASLADAQRSRSPTGVQPGSGRPNVKAMACTPRQTAGCRCRAGSARSWPGRPSPRGSASPSRRRRCAAGCRRTPSNRGSTGRGSSSPIPTSPPKPKRVLDLYDRVWDGQPLGGNDYVISADEKTSIQARCRCHPTLPAWQGPHDAGQPRLPPRRRGGLPGRLRRPPREGLRPLRAHHRHRPVHRPGRTRS